MLRFFGKTLVFSPKLKRKTKNSRKKLKTEEKTQRLGGLVLSRPPKRCLKKAWAIALKTNKWELKKNIFTPLI